jgi:hypothetical protein
VRTLSLARMWGDMDAGGLLAHVERHTDLSVRLTVRKRCEYLSLAVGQREVAAVRLAASSSLAARARAPATRPWTRMTSAARSRARASEYGRLHRRPRPA